MTRDEKIIRNKVGVLELAKQLGSVSHACRIVGRPVIGRPPYIGGRTVAGRGSSGPD